MTPGMRLRSHLIALVLAVIVPMVVFAAIVVVMFGRQQRADAQRGAVATARALNERGRRGAGQHGHDAGGAGHRSQSGPGQSDGVSCGGAPRAVTAGYDMHVPKPVDPGEFTAIIASVAQRGTAA